MSTMFRSHEIALAEALALSIRGPRRNGLFAVWLFVRLAGDLLPAAAVADRSHRRRLVNYERRLASLSLPPALRRALVVAGRQLRDGSAASASLAVAQLAPTVRETLGPRAGETVQAAAMACRASAVATPDDAGTPPDDVPSLDAFLRSPPSVLPGR